MRLLGLSVAVTAVLLATGCSSASSSPGTSPSTSPSVSPSTSQSAPSAQEAQAVASAAEGYFHALAAADVPATCAYVDPSLMQPGIACAVALKAKLAAGGPESRGGMDKLVVPPDAVAVLTPSTAEVTIGKTKGMTAYAMSFNRAQVMQWTLKNGKWLITGGRTVK